MSEILYNIPIADSIGVRSTAVKYVCTFGSGQKYANRYIIIHAYDEQEARQLMQKYVGHKWSMIYHSDFNKDAEDYAGVREFNLEVLTIDEIQKDREKEIHTPQEFNPIEGVF